MPVQASAVSARHALWRRCLHLCAGALAGVLLVALPVQGQDQPRQEGTGLELRILHVNDTHAHLAGTDSRMNACLDATGCRGGLGRIAAAIRTARQRQDNVLALDAGDQFQGTLFYSVGKWPVIAAVDRLLPYDAMTLGNHEFDEGCAALAQFLRAQPLTVLAANLVPAQGCPLAGSRILPFCVRRVRGIRVGIIGLANDTVREQAAACPQTRFLPAVEALRRCVTTLRAQGIRHILVLSHLGLERDRELARSVVGVDVVVGGHSHAVLGPGAEDGPYPVVEHALDGAPVLVVTAGRAARYLGDLTLVFDAAGVPVAWTGGLRELAPALPRDVQVERLVRGQARELHRYRTQRVGQHSIVMADGMEACRRGDCFSGLLTADAFLAYGRSLGTTLALVNGGSLRAALPPGMLSQGDLLALHPFAGQVHVREYTGSTLWEALEHAVSGPGGKGPQLLQVAGMRYRADVSRPAGQRLLAVELVNARGESRPLDPAARYRVVLTRFLANGGDGFFMLRQGRLLAVCPLRDRDLLERYLARHSPLQTISTGRILLEGMTNQAAP
ncbi:bifunctional metallophosphatase/5'-nucleotidase [uncultured Desulfovibrio sp.]|uniref:bifunctional metallophosphatase/5'-nucleotidase n=1 Tax=uncultured Desulfovibrio sp. TaxID=167968 RepID=UPI00261ADBE9|nr:bifunctional metallophosphatase/5'-nucleotidase [uncultured Desulfovibrio sp.]